MLTYRRPASAYSLRYHSPQARIQRAGRAVIRWAMASYPRIVRATAAALSASWRARFGWTLCALMLLVAWLPVRDADREAELRAANERAAQAEIRMTALADWHRDNTARVTIEGGPARLANLALQIASAVRP